MTKNFANLGITENMASSSGTTSATSPPALTVTPYTKWNQVQEYLCSTSSSTSSSRQPVILNRASTTNTTNPFGATFCYGVQDIIFEIIQNNYIASVILYREEKRQGKGE